MGGLYLALKDKLNPKMAIGVIGLFTGVAIATGVVTKERRRLFLRRLHFVIKAFKG